MKAQYIVYLLLIILSSCSRSERTDFYDLVDGFDVIERPPVLADGAERIPCFVRFKTEAVPEKIKASVRVINATFEDSEEEEMELEIRQTPEEDNIATFTLNTTTNPGRVIIVLDVNGYTERRVVVAEKSEPSSISLAGSLSSAPINYLGEVTFTGAVRNSRGGKVSTGVKARFTAFQEDGSPADGNFRQLVTTTGAMSQVSAVFSPGLVVPNQFLTLKVEIVDDNGNPIGIEDTVTLYVYPL